MTDKKKILICEDDHDFVQLLAIRLTKENFEIAVAFDGVQAIQFARKLKPDCIVLDIGMPGGNGYETLRKLNNNSETFTIPVIMMSGNEPDMSKLSEFQQANFLKKPFDVARLVETIHRLTGVNISKNEECTPAGE